MLSLFPLHLQYRGSRELGLIEHPDDITNCSIDECESSNGYLSTTYKLTAFFKCRSQITGGWVVSELRSMTAPACHLSNVGAVKLVGIFFFIAYFIGLARQMEP